MLPRDWILQSHDGPFKSYFRIYSGNASASRMRRRNVALSGSIPLQPAPFWCKFNLWRIVVSECMVRRLTAREKLVDEESLRQCIRPVCGDVSPGHDEIRRVPVLRNPSAV